MDVCLCLINRDRQRSAQSPDSSAVSPRSATRLASGNVIKILQGYLDPRKRQLGGFGTNLSGLRGSNLGSNASPERESTLCVGAANIRA